jgi:L-arabinonolactonase
MQVICAVQCENILGEGPLWHAQHDRLYWADIAERKIHWLEHDSGRTGSWTLPVRVSAIGMRRNGGLLLATDRGFAVFDTLTEDLNIRLHPEPDRSGNRPNDGHADAMGRFWVGTMDDAEEAWSGAVYRLDPDWNCTRVLDGLGVPNTLVCTPDCTTLFLAESRNCELFRMAVDPSGRLHDRRRIASTVADGCTPDGSAIDEEGFLWNAQWGGSRIVRYSPNGVVDRIVTLPVEQPTSCAFGGSDLSTLFITTARKGLSSDALTRQPWAGAVLAFRPGVCGVPAPCFGG